MPDNKITELDWWQTKFINGLSITAAPAKHTSERGMFDKNRTLWASYGIRGAKQNLFLRGDSGWHEGLYDIGERLGPFDATFFEIGVYSNLKGQMELHYTPEQAVKAHKAVRGSRRRMTHGNYQSRKSRLLKNFDRSIAHVKGVLTTRYGAQQANNLDKEVTPGIRRPHPSDPLYWREQPFSDISAAVG